MPKPADIGGKKLANVDLSAWVKWLLQREDVEGKELLNAEFQWISRDSDLLIRTKSAEHGEFLTLNELQLRPHKDVPRRVNAYAALAEEKYHLPVYVVVLNILPSASEEALVDYYESSFLGQHARRTYRVINMWEIDASYAFDPALPSLLPFVPVMKGGNTVEMVKRAAVALEAHEDLQEFKPLLIFLAHFVLKRERLQKILRWNMDVIEKTDWYQEIIEKGRAEGIERGIERGIEQERRQMTRHILEKQVGPLPEVISEKLQTLDANALSEVLDIALSTPTLEALYAYLSLNDPAKN